MKFQNIKNFLFKLFINTKKNNIEKGFKAQSFALKYLLNKNYKLIAKNFRFKHCEIDLVIKDNDSVIFVEVKSVLENSMYNPMIKINYKKKQNIIKCAKFFLKKYNFSDINYRFDLVFVFLDKKNKLKSIQHIENAFQKF